MMFNCVKALAATDFTHLRQNYLINKLLANYFFSAHSRQILQAHSQASRFCNSEFEVVCEAETTRTEYETTTATSTFKLDTDALYLETMLSGGDQQNTYSRLSRLVELYYFETTASSGSAST